MLYLQARHQLFVIEAREAATFFSKRLLLGIVAVVFLLFGYALLLAGAIIVIDHFTRGIAAMLIDGFEIGDTSA